MRRIAALLAALSASCSALTVPLAAASPATSLSGISLASRDGQTVSLADALTSTEHEKTMLVFGTHAADFNTVEYLQRVKFYLPRLRDKGVGRQIVVVNGDVAQITKLGELLDMPAEVEILADPTGDAGRLFGVSRGFRPDDAKLSPFLKLFVVGIGLGPPWGTLWPVLTGYFGSPSGKRDWIEASLRQGQLQGRWPNPLELSGDKIVGNAFDNTPLLGGWGRRPFELATLRLQNLIMQGQNWEALKPRDDRCLTQLGGCTVVGAGGAPVYSWVDRGLCDVPDFEEVLEAL